MVARIRLGPFLGPVAGKWLQLLGIYVLIGFGRADEDCFYGNELISKSLYSHLIGWSCFEHVGYNGRVSEMYACVSDEGFKVPCLRYENRYLDFTSELSRNYLLEITTKEEEYTSCIQRNSPCRIKPSTDSMTRVWIPASVCDTEPRNKFHIAMLSISFIMGIPAFMFLIYFSWSDKNDVTLLLHRNLICAITFRSLMTLLIQTEIILPKSEGSNSINFEGIPALATFETLTLDLVLGFWMVLTMALWKIITNDHGIPLRVNIYTYATIGLSLSFTLIWIIVMASTQNLENWIGFRSWPQWINEPLRIIFLIFQIGLISYSVKKIFWDGNNPLEKHDPKTSRRVRIETIYVIILTPIFILQFCLNAGSPNGIECEEAFFYVYFFIDGLQGALVCLFFFYINSEVKKKFTTLFGLDIKETEPIRPIRTLDSLQDRTELENNDIVYSSVLDPERHAKTLQLYQKRNLIPSHSVTIVEGEEFRTSTNDRKISTATVFYDAVSFDEELQPIENPPELLKETQLTPVCKSKYSSIGQSLSSASSNSGSIHRQGSLVRNLSTEAVRSSMPEDLKVTPRILLTQATVDKGDSEYSKDMERPRFSLDNTDNAGSEYSGDDQFYRMKRVSPDANIRYSSSDSDTSSMKEFRDRLNEELEEVLGNVNSNSNEDSIEQGSGSSSDSDSQEDGKVPDNVMNILSNKNLDRVKKFDDDGGEYSDGDGKRKMFRQSSSTNIDILDDGYDANVDKNSEYSTGNQEIENSSSSSDDGEYSDDERVPDSIMNLLLSKKPGNYTSDYSESRNIAEDPKLDHDEVLPTATEMVKNHDSDATSGKIYDQECEYSEGKPHKSQEIHDKQLVRSSEKNETNSSSDSEEHSTENPVFITNFRKNEQISNTFDSDSSENSVKKNSNPFKKTKKYSKQKEFERTPIPTPRRKTSENSSEHSIQENINPFKNSNENSTNLEDLERKRLSKNRNSSNSDSSEHSHTKTSKPSKHSNENAKTEPDFDKIPLPNKPRKNNSSSSSESSEYSDNEKPSKTHSHPEYSPDDLELQPENPHAQTLPRCSEPVPKPRPLSLSDERRTKFSTMFSKHRDKILSSRSPSDTHRASLKKFPGSLDLTKGENFEPGTSTSTPDDQWLPQDVHFANE